LHAGRIDSAVTQQLVNIKVWLPAGSHFFFQTSLLCANHSRNLKAITIKKAANAPAALFAEMNPIFS
jgi:hypothetical protein